ncbi:MAG: PAS domain S-box protein [Bacteroidetes bacterium]|nr:PAS domain S-box protein [Bacteroidota bacterium]
MRKNRIVYIIAIVVMLGILLIFNKEYQVLSLYADISDENYRVHNVFLDLAKYENKERFFRRSFIREGSSDEMNQLFEEYKNTIIADLDTLHSIVKDEQLQHTFNQLKSRIQTQLNESSERNSLTNAEVSQNDALIDSLLHQGISRSLLLVHNNKQQIHKEILWLRWGILFFIVVTSASIIVLFIGLSKQKSKRRLNLKELKQQQEILASIVNLSEDAIFSKTTDGTIITWNKGAEKIYGYTANEIIGKKNAVLIPGDLRYEDEQIFKRIMLGEQVQNYETRRVTRNGNSISVSVTISPVKDSKGNIVGAAKISRDITERVQLQEKIRLQNEELTGILERITDGFIILDNDFRYVFVNKEICKMVNRRPEDLIGKIVWEEFPEAIGSPTYYTIINARDTQQFGSSVDYYPPLGLWQENRVYPGGDKLSIFIRDISEQKRAEEKIAKSEKIYKTIASSIPGSLICIMDTDYRYLLIEGDMLEGFGYTRDELVGNKASAVIPSERFNEVLPNLRRVFNGESFSFDSKRNNRYVLNRYVPLKDESEQIYAAMIVLIDVTHLKLAEEKIMELNTSLETKVAERTAQLEAVNKELEAFTYSVSHDLRAPLRAINGYAKIVEEDYHTIINDEGKRLLKVIKDNATKMGALIDELLRFSKLGRKALNRSWVNMNELVTEVIREMNYGNPTTVQINIGKLHTVPVDKTLMHHVLFNLISNAVKYSDKANHPMVEINSEKKDSSWIFSVKDNGVGFDMKYADKLFGVFQRLHSESEFPGTGVGLAIVQRIITKHGGNVWANAELNKGAQFYFSIPEQQEN